MLRTSKKTLVGKPTDICVGRAGTMGGVWGGGGVTPPIIALFVI